MATKRSNLERFLVKETSEQKFCTNIINAFQKIDMDTFQNINFSSQFDKMIYAKKICFDTMASHDSKTSLLIVKVEFEKYFENVANLFESNNNLENGHDFFGKKNAVRT